MVRDIEFAVSCLRREIGRKGVRIGALVSTWVAWVACSSPVESSRPSSGGVAGDSSGLAGAASGLGGAEIGEAAGGGPRGLGGDRPGEDGGQLGGFAGEPLGPVGGARAAGGGSGAGAGPGKGTGGASFADGGRSGGGQSSGGQSSGGVGSGGGPAAVRSYLPCDVDEILEQNCRTCHSPSGWAQEPSLESFGQVREQSDTILDVLSDNYMPYGGPPLPPEVKAVLTGWLEAGAVPIQSTSGAPACTE